MSLFEKKLETAKAIFEKIIEIASAINALMTLAEVGTKLLHLLNF